MRDMSPPANEASLPDPGQELIFRVAGTSDRESFFSSGRQSVRELERTLTVVDRPLDSFESILDFGCGCGRMLLWMKDVARTSAIHGTDIDAEAIAWCRRNIPYARVVVNDPEPPLPFPDEAFDLVFNHSVFTHIDERRQDLWLTELQRVTRAGGFIVLSVHGEVALPNDDWSTRDRLEQSGIAYRNDSLPRDFPLPDWYQNTWHAPWYVLEHWARWFDVRAYIPGAALGYQDHILLERRAGDTPRPTPIRARPRSPEKGAPESRVATALAVSRAHREGRATTSQLRILRRLLRRLALRAIRPYTVHEDNFDNAVAASIADLSRAVDQHASTLAELKRHSEEN